VFVCVEYELQNSTKSSEDVSSEIVVVHNKVVPKLHGILKQRTVSESSDDGVRACLSGCDHQTSTTTGSEGDDHEDSPDRSTASAVSGGRPVLKKSVSFNDHVDHTLFQANQSVSSMHAALKNRRRRARKRDQKQEQREQRRRRRSSGSFSLEESGDEQTTGVQPTHVHISSAQTNNSDSSSDISSDKADAACSNPISLGTEITNEKALSPHDLLSSESASAKEDVRENEKSTQSVLKGKLMLDETRNENYNHSETDTFRTKHYVEDCDSDVENNGFPKPTDVCDNLSSVQVFENCASEVSNVDLVCANAVCLADHNSSSQPAAMCGHDTAVEPLKLSQSNDSGESVAVSPENIAVSNTCCLLDLDVD